MQVASFAIEQKPLKKVAFLKGTDCRRYDAMPPTFDFWTLRLLHGILQE